MVETKEKLLKNIDYDLRYLISKERKDAQKELLENMKEKNYIADGDYKFIKSALYLQ